MIRSHTRLIALCTIALVFQAANLQAGDTVDNPRYALWSGFKEGSSATLSVDMDVDNNRVHFEITRTLISVTPDQVVIETTTKSAAQDQRPPVRTTIPAKSEMTDIKEAGNREILAMGKTFHCKVWDATGENPNDATHSGMGDLTGGTKAVLFMNDQVPGGIVERDAVDQNGKQMNYVLTAMEVK